MNLKSLARTLGISKTTVSRALNGYPEVNIRTRERVLAAAKAAGYEANPMARSLAVGRTNVFGIIYPLLPNDQGDRMFMDGVRGLACARPKASRTTRSTPKAVLTLTSVAISCGVPLRSTPPLPAYGPSVPPRTTTKSMAGSPATGKATPPSGRAGPRVTWGPSAKRACSVTYSQYHVAVKTDNNKKGGGSMA